MIINEMFVSSDMFLSLPLSAQVLYFHMAARANSEGYLLNPLAICRMVGASEEDYNLLLEHKVIEEPEGFYGIDIKV
ncbi:MAG: hypothetical protein IKL09_02250 [Clostridia bacterium]|nr:hypothetical protein [Clostridia bacterium]